MRLATIALAAALLAQPAFAQDEEPAATTFTREEVSFETEDGLTIAATYWAPADMPQKAPCVLALHMYRNMRASWEPLAKPVTDRGCALLAIDMRGHGESELQGEDDLSERVMARDAELFNSMHLDAEAAIKWLYNKRRTPRGRIAIVGASVGCSVAIHTATKKPLDTAGVAVLTPGENYLGVPSLEHAERWYKTTPLRIYSSEEERKIGADGIHAKLAEKGAVLTIVPGEKIHGTHMFGKVDGFEGRLADWLTARATAPVANGRLGDGELDGAVHGKHDGHDVYLRFIDGRLYLVTKFESQGHIESREVGVRITLPGGQTRELPDEAGMGMHGVDLDLMAKPVKGTAVSERYYLVSELGAGESDLIGVQVAFDDGDFGPTEPIQITLE